MNLTFISPHSDPQAQLGEPDAGGQCVYEHQLALQLSQNPDNNVVTFVRDQGKRQFVSKVKNNYYIVRIPAGPRKFIPKEQIGIYLAEFAQNILKFQNVFLEDTVLHAHYWDGGAAALHLMGRSQKPIPLIWTPHSLGSLKMKNFTGLTNEIKYNFIPRLTWERYTSLLADAIVVSSQEEKNHLASYYGMSKDKIIVGPPGVDFDRLHRIDSYTARKKLKLPQGKQVVMSFGRISPTKGYERLIKAFAQLPKRTQSNTVLVICGGSRSQSNTEEFEYQTTLTQLAEDLGIADHVLFRPAVGYERVNRVYSAADLFITSALNEPFGLTILESMAMGVPTIIDKTANFGYLRSGHNIVRTDTSNPDDLAQAIDLLLQKPTVAQRIGTNGQAAIRFRYSWRLRTKQYLDIYQRSQKLPRSQILGSWIETNHFLRQILSLQVTPNFDKVSPNNLQKGTSIYAHTTSYSV